MTKTMLVMLCIAVFIVGVIVGGILMAICAVSGEADERMEQLRRERRDE